MKSVCKVVAAIVGRDRMEEIKFNCRGVYGGITRDGFPSSVPSSSPSAEVLPSEKIWIDLDKKVSLKVTEREEKCTGSADGF